MRFKCQTRDFCSCQLKIGHAHCLYDIHVCMCKGRLRIYSFHMLNRSLTKPIALAYITIILKENVNVLPQCKGPFMIEKLHLERAENIGRVKNANLIKMKPHYQCS